MIQLPPVFNEKNVGKLRELLENVETHYRGLDALKVDENSYSSIVVPIILDKIPETVRLNMIRGSKNQKEWNMKEMLQVLDQELDIREQHVSIFKGRLQGQGSQVQLDAKAGPFFGKPTTTTASALLANENRGGEKTRKCTFCQEDHVEQPCEKVKGIEEREKIISK